GIPMLAEILVRMRDAGATFEEVDVDMVQRTDGVPSAARFKVMRRTLLGLFDFYRTWRAERESRAPFLTHDGAASGPKPRAPAEPDLTHDGAASGPKPRAPAEPDLTHDGAASGPKPRAPAEPSRDRQS